MKRIRDEQRKPGVTGSGRWRSYSLQVDAALPGQMDGSEVYLVQARVAQMARLHAKWTSSHGAYSENVAETCHTPVSSPEWNPMGKWIWGNASSVS